MHCVTNQNSLSHSSDCLHILWSFRLFFKNILFQNYIYRHLHTLKTSIYLLLSSKLKLCLANTKAKYTLYYTCRYTSSLSLLSNWLFTSLILYCSCSTFLILKFNFSTYSQNEKLAKLECFGPTSTCVRIDRFCRWRAAKEERKKAGNKTANRC